MKCSSKLCLINTPLNADQQRKFGKLVSRLIKCAESAQTSTYSDLERPTGIRSRNQKGILLGRVHNLCVAFGCPPLNALVVGKQHGICGAGAPNFGTQIADRRAVFNWRGRWPVLG